MKKLIVGLLFLLSSFSSYSTQSTLRFITEDLPPLQLNNGKAPASGAMVELIQLILNEAQLKGHIEFYPWAYCYQLVKSEPNTFIFSMLRDPSREPYFQWIDKIYQLESHLVSLKRRRDISIKSLEEAKKFTTAAIRDDLAETYMKAHGFVEKEHLYLTNAYPALWHMLYNGRTDLAFTNNLVWHYEIERTGLDPSLIKFQYQIPDVSTGLYLAANINTDTEIIKQLRAAFSRLKADGRYNALLKKWKL